jgi:hypothetical protein
MSKKYILLYFILFFTIASSNVFANEQKLQELEARIAALEVYAQTIQPTLVDLTTDFNNTLNSYTTSLGERLINYTDGFQASLDEKLKIANKNIVVLSTHDRAYQHIATNSGSFFISVGKYQKVDGKHRLKLMVGNPNYAQYRGVTFRIWHGAKWKQDQNTYEEWRSSLRGVEFKFDQKLETSYWTPFFIDLAGDVGYVECEMSIAAVEFLTNK